MPTHKNMIGRIQWGVPMESGDAIDAPGLLGLAAPLIDIAFRGCPSPMAGRNLRHQFVTSLYRHNSARENK